MQCNGFILCIYIYTYILISGGTERINQVRVQVQQYYYCVEYFYIYLYHTTTTTLSSARNDYNYVKIVDITIL